MIRNLKILGLAVAALLALGAVTASGASAQGKFTAASGSALGTATQNGLNALTLTGNKTECPNADYIVGKIGTTNPHGTVLSGATEVTVAPNYGTCHTIASGVTFATTVDMNGCDYTFKLGATTGGVNGTYGITAGVVCPADKDIVVTIGTGANPHSTVWCHVTIEYEAGKHYHGLHATDTGGHHIRVHGTVTGFKTLQTNHGNSSGFPHANLLPCSGTDTEATPNPPLLHIDATVESSHPVTDDLSLSHP